MFSKKLSALTPADLQSVFDRQVQEDEEIEFKRSLATKNGKPDLWMVDTQNIGKEAKVDIAKELIAFANTRGGTLILGIAENGEKRASSFELIPKCRQLADRLAASIVSSTDPKIESIEYEGIELEGDSGVVIFRVGASARAPHRDRDTREAYYRNSDKSEPMSMRQVQDMSVEKWQGLQSVQQRLNARPFVFPNQLHKDFKFSEEGQPIRIEQTSIWVGGCRATAVPVERIFINDIARQNAFKLADAALYVKQNDQQRELIYQPELVGWKPILRGIRRIDRDNEWAIFESRTILADGLIEIKATAAEFAKVIDAKVQRSLHVLVLFRRFAQFLVMVECFRRLIGRPNLEYAISFEWRVPPAANLAVPSSGGWGADTMHSVEELNTLSDLSMPTWDEIDEFWANFQMEFFQSFGQSRGNLYPIDFDAARQYVLERSKG